MFKINSRKFSNLIVYGHFISQPSRAVLWLLKINNFPHEFKKLEPIRGDTKKEDFVRFYPTAQVPAIDDSGFHLAEGSAIMQYLCEKNNWNEWWPTSNSEVDLQKRAKIAEYLSYHHHGDRLISHRIIRPVLEEVFSGKPGNIADWKKREEFAFRSIQKFEDIFLKNGDYVNGFNHPTIADLTAYTEIAQLHHLQIMSKFDQFPLTKSWMSKISLIPHHDDVHRTAVKAGEMVFKYRKSNNLTD